MVVPRGAKSAELGPHEILVIREPPVIRPEHDLVRVEPNEVHHLDQGWSGCSERYLIRHGGGGEGSPAAGAEEVSGAPSERTPSTLP
jgi:hypothetical protein